MTGMYVICTRTRRRDLSERRYAWEEHRVDNLWCHLREEHISGFLGERKLDRLGVLPPWAEDIRSVADDAEACFFFLDQTNREPVDEMVRRGLRLPVGRLSEMRLRIDRERYPASEI